MSIEELRAKARKAHSLGQLAEAEEYYRRLLEEKPTTEDAANLGSLLRSTGRLSDAIILYNTSIKKYPRASALRNNAINCAIEKGDIEQSYRWISEGLAITPNDWTLHRARARTLIRERNYAKALSILKEICKQHPRERGLWMDIALTLHHLEQWDQASEALEKAIKLDPEDPRAYCNMLGIYKVKGEWEEATAYLQTLSQSLRDSLPIISAEADLALAQRDFEKASVLFKKLCIEEPEAPLHWLNQAACYKAMREPTKALATCKRGFSLHPYHSLLRKALTQGLTEQGKQKRVQTLLRQDLEEAKLTKLTQLELFNLQFIGSGYQLISPDDLKQTAQEWEKSILSEGTRNLWGDRIQEPIQGRRIRIGYLSSDFCNHPVGRFMLPLLEAHDKNHFEIIGFNSGSIRDSIQEQIKECCSQWVDLQHHTSLEGARVISDLRPDIVIELGGFTAGSRVDFLCHKPCKVQLSYLGYFAPTYLRCIDGWIGDDTLFHQMQQQNCHQLYYIKGGYMAYADPSIGRIEEIKENRPVKIGCFNHARKLTKETIELFVDVVKSIDQEVKLVLKSYSFKEDAEKLRVKNEFLSAGLPQRQLEILPCTDTHQEHLLCYHLIDVALDPIPYGGATTTCEALIMGVPVVTLQGVGMVRRLSSSILTACGCNEWISNERKQFIDTCGKLVKGGVRSQRKRLDLREKVISSPLCDNQRLAREFEKLARSILIDTTNS